MAKLQPAVLRMTFDVDPGLHFVDVSHCASILNRRFYRQGLNWAIAGITLVDETSLASGGVEIEKLPNTWVMSNAWEKGFRAWSRQQREALENGDQQSVRARFNDFKIHMNQGHVALGYANNLMPSNFTRGVDTGEWESSQIVIPNYLAVGTNIEPEVVAVGASLLPSQFSLIDAYSNSRSVPQSPDPAVPAGVLSPTDNIYKAMFDVGDNTDQVMDNAIGKNDELPYDQTLYPGDGVLGGAGLERVTKVFFSPTTISSANRVGGFNAPCGLIRLDQLSGQTLKMYIDLVPGKHRGYLCEPMQDM